MALLIYVAITLPLSLLVRHYFGSGMAVNSFMQLVYLTTALWTISKGMTGRVWTYHGAEHKAVNAYENGCDLDDVDAIQRHSRVHQRCGTNLVYLIMAAIAVYVPSPDAKLNVLLSTLYVVFAMAISLELFRQLMRWPQFIFTKMLLFGGNMLQRFVTTKEPENDQVVVASKALQLVLALETSKHV
ncbi:MAG: DUF1385 domain-containing protein [Rubrobacteridae bacterium]|nr:DUF1385 domain-containing protein [Rubrobacteridae bacterium]